MTEKTFIYLRLSRDISGESVAVDRQERLCRADAEGNGEEVVAVFNDNDISATDGSIRPDFQKMLTLLDDEVSMIRCYDIDRLYRVENDLAPLVKLKVRLRSHTGADLDLNTPAGRMLAKMLCAVGRYEGEHKAERSTDAYRDKAHGKDRKDGRARPSWKYAFGYVPETRIGRADDGTRKIDPVTGPLVEQAYRLLLAGGKLTDVVSLWNENGGTTIFAGRTGRRGRSKGKQFSGMWNHSSARKCLQDPRNAGLRDYTTKIDGKLVTEIVTDENGQPVKGTWPPLVDEALFYAVQDVLNSPERLKAGNRTVQKYLLTGILQCGLCGAYLNGNRCGEQGPSYLRKRDNTLQQYPAVYNYACRGCNRLAIGTRHVEPVVIATIAGRLAMDDAQDLLKAELHDAAEAEALRTEENVLHAQIAAAEAEYDDGTIDGRRLKGRIETVNEKLNDVRRRKQDQKLLQVFHGLKLGEDAVVEQIERLALYEQNRFRAVVQVICTVTVMPIGRGQHTKDQIRERTAITFTDGKEASAAYAKYVEVKATLGGHGDLRAKAKEKK